MRFILLQGEVGSVPPGSVAGRGECLVSANDAMGREERGPYFLKGEIFSLRLILFDMLLGKPRLLIVKAQTKTRVLVQVLSKRNQTRAQAPAQQHK